VLRGATVTAAALMELMRVAVAAVAMVAVEGKAEATVGEGVLLEERHFHQTEQCSRQIQL
jgi:hypothetical protein